MADQRDWDDKFEPMPAEGFGRRRYFPELQNISKRTELGEDLRRLIRGLGADPDGPAGDVLLAAQYAADLEYHIVALTHDALTLTLPVLPEEED